MVKGELGLPSKPLQMEGEQWKLEERTTDPASTSKGEAWLRTDLDDTGVGDTTDQIGTLRFDNGSGIWDVPIYTAGTAVDGTEEVLRIPVGGTVGYVPVRPDSADPAPAFPQIGFQHAGSRHGLHNYFGGDTVLELIDDFEDGDTTTESANWNGWNTNNFSGGDSFSAQQTTVIAGSWSGEFRSDGFPQISTVRNSETTNSIQVKIRIGSDVSNSSDAVYIQLRQADDTVIGNFRFVDGGGAIEWEGTTVQSSWAPNTNYTVVFEWDFPNDQVTIKIDDVDKGLFAFASAASGVAKILVNNDTNTTGATRSVFLDDVAEV